MHVSNPVALTRYSNLCSAVPVYDIHRSSHLNVIQFYERTWVKRTTEEIQLNAPNSGNESISLYGTENKSRDGGKKF